MKKRTWVYIMSPSAYEMACDICGGSNLAWSEFQKCVWCPDCKKDTPGAGGIFDGPIAHEVAEMFGISFDRINLKSKKVKKMVIEGEKSVWR